jgi:hypothetical protein
MSKYLLYYGYGGERGGFMRPSVPTEHAFYTFEANSDREAIREVTVFIDSKKRSEGSAYANKLFQIVNEVDLHQ